MAITQLTDEQIRRWSIEQKDRWWLENVFRGDTRQLTLRSALAGIVIGSVLSLTNLYVGMKVGWTLGVGITSVVLAFTFFKILQKAGLASEFTVLENNCMQSIATAAGYMTSPLIAGLAAYMMITDTVIPMLATVAWIVSTSVLGVLCAIPLKRRFINHEQHPFPEGRATGIMLDALHTRGIADGMFKGKLLAMFASLSALLELLKSGEILEKVGLRGIAIPPALEGWFLELVGWQPKIKGIPLSELTVSIQPDQVMMAVGGLMGIRTGVSLLIGAVVNYCVLAPWIIECGGIHGTIDEMGVAHYGFVAITTWALWCGVAIITTASLVGFFGKPRLIYNAITEVLKPRSGVKGCLAHVELPTAAFLVGLPLVGGVVVYFAHYFFGLQIWMGVVAVAFVWVFAVIAVNVTSLTSITPIGPLSKLTQVIFAVLAPGSATTNIITASITAQVAANASNLLSDIKPGYMLGGKPRHQAVGHLLGIVVGALSSVPVFYFVFLRNNPSGLVNEEFTMPAALLWRAVAELLTRGLSSLPQSAMVAAAIAASLGIALEVTKMLTKGRFPISGVGIGLAFVIPFTTCFAMFVGSFFFWILGKSISRGVKAPVRILVDNLEPVCAGVIAGGALMGIAIAALRFVVLPNL